MTNTKTKHTSDDLKSAVLEYLISALKSEAEDPEEVPAGLVNAALNYLKQFPPTPEDPTVTRSSQELSGLLRNAAPAVRRKFEARKVPTDAPAS